jgi:hypothetical protein
MSTTPVEYEFMGMYIHILSCPVVLPFDWKLLWFTGKFLESAVKRCKRLYYKWPTI